MQSARRELQQDTGSVQSPASNPSSTGVGQQEEPMQSQSEMKRDASEPEAKKRKEELPYKQNKKSDAADD